MKKIFLAAMALLAMNGANAQHSIGGGILSTDADEISFTSAVATYEYKFNDSIGMQLGLAKGGDDEVFEPTVGTIDVELDYALFYKVKAGMPTALGFLYATIGYSNLELEASALGFSVDESIDGTIAGFGMDFSLSDQWGLGVEYARGFGDLEDTNLIQAVLQFKF